MARLFLAPVGVVQEFNTIASGLLACLQYHQIPSICFKPVISSLNAENTDSVISVDVASDLIACGKTDDLQDEIVSRFFNLCPHAEQTVVMEGLCADEYNLAPLLNPKIAQTLSTKVILVINAANKDVKKITRQLNVAAQQYDVPIAGFILNHCLTKTENVQIIEQNVHFPCLGVSTAEQISSNLVEKGLFTEKILLLVKDTEGLKQTPAVFRFNVIKKARKANKTIVLPEGDEPRTIKAAVICQQKKIAKCILLGESAKIEAVAKAEDILLPADLTIINPDDIREKYIAPMVELRKSKGLTPEDAAEQLKDTVVLGTMMLAQNDVDGLVSGAIHTTASTVRPALQLIKTRPGESLVSSVFFMLMPDEVNVFGDCAINPEPTAEQLADIAIQSSDSALAFGLNPRVAMLSYSTGKSGTGAAVDKVVAATALVQEKRPDLLIDGPLQYDAATVPTVAQQKAPNSKVAGRANVLIVPDLNTGNNCYKAVQRAASLISVGPMLQGLRKPVNDLSRGALVEDIVYTIALTAIQATQI